MNGEALKSSLLMDEVLSRLNCDKDWPDGVELYRPLEEEELLPDIAKSLTVEAFLIMHELREKYKVLRRKNSEHMTSRKGTLPFLRIGNEIVGEDMFLDYLHKKGLVLNVDLNAERELVINGVISMIRNELYPIEMYAIWMDEKNLQQTLERYEGSQPEPLKTMLGCGRRKAVQNYLNAAGFLTMNKKQVVAQLTKVFSHISQRLEKNKYIIGDLPSEADVFVYGHVQAILESKLPDNFLLETLDRFPKLENFCLNFKQVHLHQQAMLWDFF